MLVELHLLGGSERWRISGRRARMGRDPACEVPLAPDRYPMVSREHAILTIEDGRIRLMDNQSTNGFFVNGTRTANAMLTRLDRFSLGKDGPEFEISIIEERPASAPTIVQSQIHAEPADPASTPTRIARPDEYQASAGVMAEARKVEPRQSQEQKRGTTASVIEPTTGVKLSQEEEQVIEQKLNSLRNLVYLLVAMVAVLLGIIFYQSQQIDKNRAELNDMRRQAQSAVAQFTPALDSRLGALDQRLSTFDQRLNQVDVKMKDTEDQFMSRLNNELPRMLDRYVDRKVKQLGEAAPQVTKPEEK